MASDAEPFEALSQDQAARYPLLAELMSRSARFPVPFPVQAVRCCQLLQRRAAPPQQLSAFIESARPLLHESVVRLYAGFLRHKARHGTASERELYRGMTVTALVHRLLTKRAVSFYGPGDAFTLLDGTRGSGWPSDPSADTLLERLSYDEIKLSALLSVSSYSVFINSGSRGNKGVPAPSCDAIQQSGVVVGLIGPRLEKEGVMEWEDVVVSRAQNVAAHGYGESPRGPAERASWRKLWADFYGASHFPLYDRVKRSPDRAGYVPVGNLYLNKAVYSARLAVSFETLLLEAQARAACAGRRAYVHVVGIGLGVWSLSPDQEAVFLEAFSRCLTRLAARLPDVGDLDFSWFTAQSLPQTAYGHIRIHFSRRSPHDSLPAEHRDKLLVVSYAWDGNALPGNEFWVGALSSSGDPAQACSSQIAELHNPHINSAVCGENTRVLTVTGEALPIQGYLEKHVYTGSLTETRASRRPSSR